MSENKIKQKRFENNLTFIGFCNLLSLDFFLPIYNIFIECQGRQHFTPVFAFGPEDGFIETQKKRCAKI
jgi:hypothetical protein